MSERKDSDQISPIDLIDLARRFLRTARRLWVLALVLALLLSCIYVYRAYRSYQPYYESKALFSVNSGYAPDDIFSTSFYDNLAAQQLAEAFPHMLQMELMQDLMRLHLDVPYITGSVSAVCVANTNMFWLSVRSSSPQDAYDILWAVIDCFPQMAVYMVDNPQVVIRNQPAIPTAPYNSFSWKLPAAKGFILGFGLAAAIILLLSLMTKTVSTVDQLKSLVNLPVLATLPLVPLKKRRKDKVQSIWPGSRILEEPLQGLSLAVQKQLEGKRRVILTTSTLAGEGKTTVAAGLALALANTGNRVVLLDADFRNQSVAARLRGKKCSKNLLECLESPQFSVSDYLIQLGASNLYYLSGNSITNIRYSINLNRMDQVLDALAAEFDYIIMDTSPCALVPDAVHLARCASCALYIVKPDYARQDQILDIVTDLYDREVQLSGFVLNGMPMGRGHYGLGYKNGYAYKYGYGYKYGRSRKGNDR